MDVNKTCRKLYEERRRLDLAIASLERASGRWPRSRRLRAVGEKA